ncbi:MULTISPECIES: hypothetical protein [Halobacterium]|nr:MULTISPECIES: hypothetical protein [Halobacterium]MCF2239608.1 hypothetical protein [Halobacterium salinarum]QRY22260.1 hypothetical protein JT689_09560 [Halobacterium sp. GSL-19]QRY24337.1 hypothetical protein JRZ79_07940 [Halobacterium sp. BOL4-2]WJK63632.1 hypothetical protein QSJ49_10575 [Halobacterium salinarum]
MASNPDPAAVAADADVLAADVFVDGHARAALDVVRAHDWVTLVASTPLLDDAQAVIAALGSDALAADWRGRIADRVTTVEHPEGDQPALAAAMRGGAAHVLTHDDDLQSAATGAALAGRVSVSVKSPRAFARLFDPASLYPVVVGGDYPGPDRDPRA